MPNAQIATELAGILAIGFIAFVYFFPTFVAFFRSKRDTLAIFVLNLFLGWTLVGWVICLTWSLVKDRGTVARKIGES
jgi:hypothetical protein